ncbi:putative TRAP C4-dicarboxylate transport system permease DctM subunit [Vibrio nigripulchritudo MADA3029]|uniref:TRAP transporter large permease protein n=2 Tax=Vibrio nigripulchritudo TaxID=28173 RepID=U4KA70_9VIBR|nr:MULTISPECIES: TRAP transporter large permease [Vibrio]UAB70564.1 TRAP transporter large permease [Vibrio sp. SCSIO 43132]CCN35121.1 putative TRAP C4-dicarboxylate transport system permease DctM subunit [Vibrio nigripulchritudo AM115]CCN41714.1 putative TRAP C4-dicarboxylate transport system permease DctM subunit [Vibrio nigripulchritudo FTn2]CCN47213.1 putative TRAP C4-dicarboxylate transport system permease DctM subunit [Vibrio nigripulchritudo MADA3020]CCN55974.1 putative TRAP C4-dicarbox
MDNGTLITLISIGVTGLFLLGVPIFLVIGFWVVGCSLVIDFTLANVGVTLFEGLSFFGLLALPLFILTGDLINAAGIAKRMSDFAYSILGWVRGGLGMATIGACGMFAAISGSNAGTTATIGSIMQPEMENNKYDKRFAAATVAAGGTVGIIIPPSIIFIVYGFLLDLSISDLFIGGMLPGILMVIAMQVTCYLVSRRNNWGDMIRFEPKRIVRAGFRAYLGILAIAIVIYGIYSGTFSPTEAAGVTVGFCLIAGVLVTRQIKLSKLPEILLRSGQITGMLAPLIAVSVVMQQLLSLLGAGEVVNGWMSSIGDPTFVLLACMFLVLMAGTVLESLPNTIILAPILAPIAYSVGVDPIHFAVVFLVGDAIGFITPPYGLNLYVASGMTGIPYFTIVRHVLPYLFALMVAWLIIAFWPPLSTFLLQFGGAG